MSGFKVGILSDPHREIELQNEAIEHLKASGAEYLLHLGDFVLEENLKSLKDSNLVYRAVFGNNDNHLSNLSATYNIYKEPYYLKIKDVKFKMMHLPYYLSSDSDIVLFGHTHKFHCEFKGSSLFLNPGEVCAREKPLSEHALLEVSEDKFVVKYFFKEPQQSSWQSREYNFQRQSSE